MEQGLLARERLFQSQPLWRRVPTRDSDGKPLSDFMMLIPRLRHWPESRRLVVYRELEQLFIGYGEHVVFADLNEKLNILWVSLRPAKGMCQQLSTDVRQLIPEAVLVASQAEALVGLRVAKQRRKGIKRLLCWLD